MDNFIVKLVLLSIVFTSIHSNAIEECRQPVKPQVVFKCEKIVSSEILGRAEDKIAAANYKIWLQEDDKKRSLCANSRTSNGPSVEVGEGHFMSDSDRRQYTRSDEKL